jgi:tRNA 2-thiouridine synthesizing protein E
MLTVGISGVQVGVDEEGYLVHFEDWNEQVACALAECEGLTDQCRLTGKRMEILKFLRDYYEKFGFFPIVQSVCKKNRQPRDCEFERFLDPIHAWKIAGLPKPTTEVFTYIKRKFL